VAHPHPDLPPPLPDVEFGPAVDATLPPATADPAAVEIGLTPDATPPLPPPPPVEP
jgi:hypothetical protein